MEILNRIRQVVGEFQCEPENTGRIIFMSIFDIVWVQKEITIHRKISQRQFNSMMKDSLAVVGLSWGLTLVKMEGPSAWRLSQFTTRPSASVQEI